MKILEKFSSPRVSVLVRKCVSVNFGQLRCRFFLLGRLEGFL
jgi:hypothetical protein